jgi:hypothetical protein
MSTVKENSLDLNLVRTRFDYNPETGVVTYSGRERAHLSPSMRSRKTGRPVGWRDTHGHLNVKINNKDYLLHRVIWLHQFGEWPDGVVDHVNGNKQDNRMSNLRLVSQGINCQNNHKGLKGSFSGTLGVSPGITPGTWLANIRANKHAMRLGTFNSKEEAYDAYLNAKALVHPDSFLTQGVTVDHSKFTETALRNLRAGGFLPDHNQLNASHAAS